MAPFRSALAISFLTLGAQAVWVANAYADEPKAVLTGDLPADLRQFLVTAVGQVDGPPASRLEARRRATSAAADVIIALTSKGYYGHHVTPDVEGDNPGRAVVNIETGPQFKIAVPLIAWLGAAPPPEVQQAAEGAMGLAEGAPGQNADLLAAQGRIVSAVQQRGYADAASEGNQPEIIVDHNSRSVIPEFKVDSGPLVRLGGVDLRTEGRTNPAWVRQLGPWAEGDTYDPKDVAELDRRLHDVQVYESVTVALAHPDAEVNGLRPIVVSLADRAPSTLDLGADYSTIEGAGFDARLQRFNRAGRADTQTFLIQYGHLQSKLDAQIALPHWRVADRTLTIGAGAYANRTDAYDSAGLDLRADITRHYSKTSYRTFGLILDGENLQERFPFVRNRQVTSLTGLGALTWDRSNDPLNPSTGWRLDGRLEP
ncbi:MAG: outer membrane protein assembly factor, partial [Alphaproteobacteria bacterium]